ncbi:MAG: hypothetical protein JW709_06845 [Sedimentisphaerales bacterium]|nr:hypothetical protein [Sedimentisphaerales bacterium]
MIKAMPILLILVLWANSLRAEEMDFRYFSLPEWRTSIGSPGDLYKCTAQSNGRYQSGRRLELRLLCNVTGGTRWISHEIHSPRVPLARTVKTRDKVTITEELFLARPLDWFNPTSLPENNAPGNDYPPRQYLIMVSYKNAGRTTATLTPQIELQGPDIRWDKSQGFLQLQAGDTITPSWEIASLRKLDEDESWAELRTIELTPGEEKNLVVAINRGGYPPEKPVSWDQAHQLRTAAIDYWTNRINLPYDVIQAPDRKVQALVEACIRDLFQMLVTRDGYPVFLFGPTCYRDYWVLDGSFVKETLAMLGQTEAVNGYIDYMLTLQSPDGRIQHTKVTGDTHWKETGIAIVAVVRHARLMRDKQWLLERWNHIEKAVAAIKSLREKAGQGNPQAINYHLMPEGFGDGGIGVTAEYTNVVWNLSGLKAAVEAAQWLGKTQQADDWQKEYDDFFVTFQKAAERDAQIDEFGHRYIPVLVGPEAQKAFCARGQWSFCQSVYPGRIFAPDDPLMLSTMKMLEAHEIQGIPNATGWQELWCQCGSFYGHAWLWLGEGRKASELLPAFAGLCSPAYNFQEEIPILRDDVYKTVEGLNGDIPHVSASAEFLRLTGHILAFDRDDELHLLEGLPVKWTQAGMTTRLNGLVTPFGPLTMELNISADGKTARLHIEPLTDPSCKNIVVHLGGWAKMDTNEVLKLSPNTAHELTITIQ